MNTGFIALLVFAALFCFLLAGAKVGTATGSHSLAGGQAAPARAGAQTGAQGSAPEAAQNRAPTPKPQFQLEDGTPIKLRLQQTLSSADAQVNDRVDFDVLEEVVVDGTVVIPKGSVAWGTVTEAQSKRRMARGGKLNVNIDAVRLMDGEKAALRAVKDVKGGGHTGAMTGAMVATGIVFFPAAPLFLFMHGKDITIPKGTEITAFTNGDMKLDPAKFASAAAPPGVATSASATVGTSAPSASIAVAVASTPDGADITVDGKFVGSTPSSLQLAPGDHSVTIEKSGYKIWQRTITLTTGASPTINATLEK
jgi:PEGA domain